jgi:chitinase
LINKIKYDIINLNKKRNLHKMIICIKENQTKIEKFDTYKDMFNELTKDGSIVVSVIDGEIKLKENQKTKDEIIIHFFKTETENTKIELEKEVIQFRNELRDNVKSLMASGITLPDSEKEKLKEKFEFVKEEK